LYLIGAGRKVEVVDVEAAEEGLQREEHLGERHAQRLHLFAVDLVLDLRDARIEAAEGEADLRALACLGEHVLQDLGELRRVRAGAVLQHEGEAAARAEAADGRRVEHETLASLIPR